MEIIKNPAQVFSQDPLKTSWMEVQETGKEVDQKRSLLKSLH